MSALEETTDSSTTLIAATRIVITIAAAVSAVALWQMGSAAGREACIADAVGRYPAVPVSAFSGTQTGPLKLSFLNERQKAVSACS